MAKLYFRYGAMGSSKTANAIMVQHNYMERGQNALIVKPRLDNRDGDRVIGSRSGLSATCGFVEDIDITKLSAYDCIIVDEAQFLTKAQVEMLVSIVDDLNIPVICYGLRADFKGNLFEGSTWLLAWADSIEELKTVCWCGKKATFNTRVINGRVVKEGEQIFLGGSESYVALCRKHWKAGELGQREMRLVSDHWRDYMSFLLDADAEEQAVLKYIYKSDLYALYEYGKPLGVMALCPYGEHDVELKSIATAPDRRHEGLGKYMLEYAKKISTGRYENIFVGTDETTMKFYESAGFRYHHTLKNFFVDNYDYPVIDHGVTLIDMYYLSCKLD